MAHCPPQSLPAGHPDIYPFHHSDTNHTFSGLKAESVTYSVDHFLDHLCSFYGHIPISSLWVVQFKFDNPTLASKLALNVGEFEPGGFSSWVIPPQWIAPLHPVRTGDDNLQGLYGCFYAQSAEVIGEATTAAKTKFGENNSHAHFTPGTVLDGREPHGNLSLSFLETAGSMVDHFIRPWEIAASRMGLLARPGDQSIKADIKVIEFAVTNSGPPFRSESVPRKTTVYRNCVPINIDNRRLSYNQSNGPQVTDVQFAFNYYHLLGGPNTSTQYGSTAIVSPRYGEPGSILGLDDFDPVKQGSTVGEGSTDAPSGSAFGSPFFSSDPLETGNKWVDKFDEWIGAPLREGLRLPGFGNRLENFVNQFRSRDTSSTSNSPAPVPRAGLAPRTAPTINSSAGEELLAAPNPDLDRRNEFKEVTNRLLPVPPPIETTYNIEGNEFNSRSAAEAYIRRTYPQPQAEKMIKLL